MAARDAASVGCWEVAGLLAAKDAASVGERGASECSMIGGGSWTGAFLNLSSMQHTQEYRKGAPEAV
ncbi:hypothetical protein M6D81_22415 [Paenibacillus sp. J5C_2022]|uniref:hypothetical protein n=1 Tax=Paenibacillus sp. J5C2022 TaxID=2977129 RepID=UPI0021CFBB6B|nr:hypothetical protein [Paenibacillus sp. J5C2022]MCU6711454.1 hypothetical protein [Paenibacillus sp. J5C2022]